MVRKTAPSPSRKLSTEEALQLAKRSEDEVTLRCLQGEKPVSVFRSHNLGPEILGYKRIERCVYRWVNHPSKRRAERLSREHQAYKTLREGKTGTSIKENVSK